MNTKGIKDGIINRVKKALNNYEFITYDRLGINRNYKFSDGTISNLYYSYEAKVVWEYMKERDISFVRYGEVFEEKKYHGNKRGFLNNSIRTQRKRKLKSIM
jgi:hypothetical protein